MASASDRPALLVDRLAVSYGPVQAVRDVSLSVREHEIVALLGANGAGKTTTLRAICGLVQAAHGAVRVWDEDVTRRKVEEIVRRGVALVPEGRRIFPGLTVLENLELGATVWGGRVRTMGEELERVFELFPRLAERRHQAGWSLSGGEQQMLAIARALVARPRLLLLDEPSLGLSPRLVRTLFETIRRINEHGVTILLVEQNAALALQISQRGYVLEAGRIVVEGPRAAVMADERVRKAYLGG